MGGVVYGDAFKYLEGADPESFDLIVTDPPYASLEEHRAKGTTTRLKQSKASSNPWFNIVPNDKLGLLMRLMYRCLKKDRHLYVFCDHKTAFLLKPLGEDAGFRFWKPIVWDKVSIGMGYHYRCRYEMVLFFEKGRRRLQDLSIPDVLAFKRVRGGYPTEKPVGLMNVLIAQSSAPGERVLDPFCGSGSVGVAAESLGRVFHGVDVSSHAIKLSKSRLNPSVEETET